MKIKLYFSVLLLVLVIKNVSSNVRLQRSGSEKQYCGSKLTEIMKMVCNGSYLKRSEMGKFIKNYIQLYLLSFYKINYIFNPLYENF